MSTTCTCGDHSPHVTATRTCADGGRVELWSDGSVTSGFAYVVRGRRAPAPLAAALTACEVLRAWVALYSAREVEPLYRRAYDAALARPGLDAAQVYRLAAIPSVREVRDALAVWRIDRAEALAAHVAHRRDPWCRCDAAAVHRDRR
jgi:hypothetical protein